ncbi:MAG: hypothetical protein C0606_06045 [Hyphomicrobiales bacterium]|nr:MAG: hypothetical protein C0606_06045 [Hyphomicrobiales bacterium]
MTKTIKLSELGPGEWAWHNGVGYRRNESSEGGTWYIKYRAPVPGQYESGVAPPTHQIKERLPNCRNRSQAEGVLMARKAAIFEGTYRPRRKATPTTLADFIPTFLDAKRHLRTANKYRQQLIQHLAPFFGKKPIESISSRDCLAYYNARLDTDAAVATVNGEMACLKSLFSEAQRVGISQTNPAKGIKLKNPNNVRDRILSQDETARLFDAAARTADFMRPLFHVLFHTGMRLGEALSLRWADVQFEHNCIVVRDSKSGEGRRIPLRDVLGDELVAWKPHARGSQWVFPGRYDTSKPHNNVRKGWARLCAAAGVESLRPHDLRHNFTSQLQAAGVSDSIIMSITGHKTHVMLHRYSHSNDQMRMEAMKALPSMAPKAGSENVIKIRS